MPRGGNDPAKGQFTDTAGIVAFESGIRSQYGAFANAEDLIQAHQSRQDPALRRASLTQIDPEATDELEAGDAASKFDLEEGDSLASYSVRGNALVGVILEADGNYRKAVVAANDQYQAPVLSAAEAAEHAQLEHNATLAREAQRLQIEMHEQLEERMAELQEENAKELEKIREKAEKGLQDARKEAGLDDVDDEADSKPAKTSAKA